MDTRIKKAIEFAEYRATLSNQIQNLKYQTKTKLIYSINGGSFEVSQELIAFVFAMKDSADLVLLDINQTPIKITDVKSFLKEIKKRYKTVTDQAEQEFVKLRSARKVEKIVDLDLGE